MNIAKVRAMGPWVLIKVDEPDEKTESGRLFKPKGSMEERMGTATGVVVSAGWGKLDEKEQVVVPDVLPGQRVVFRGFLQDANRPTPFDREHCFLHMDDVMLEQQTV